MSSSNRDVRTPCSQLRSVVPRTLLSLGVLLACVWLAALGGRKLLNPDEARYAEIPREMLISGDWVTPRLDGLKYFEKPALQYWATAIAYETLGVNEFAARLWCGLAGLAGIFLAGWSGRRLFGTTAGVVAASLLAGSLMYFLLGHINTLDMGLSFFLQAAVGFFLLAQQAQVDSNSERRYMWLAYGAAALAFLSKGLIAVVLPALALIAYTAIERDFAVWRRLHLRSGLSIFAAVCLPWLAAVSIANPEFPAFFFLHEHFARFLTDVHERVQPWWYFVPLLLIGVVPWISLAAAAAYNGWRADAGCISSNTRPSFRARRFLILWVVTTVLFFSFSHSKLPSYILPALPALALLAGDYAARMAAAAVRKHLLGMILLWSMTLAALFLTPLQTQIHLAPQVLATLLGWARAGVAIALLATLLGWWLAGRADADSVRNGLVAACVGAFLGFSVLLSGSDALREQRSGYDLAQSIQPHVDAATPLYAVQAYDHSLSYYLGRTLTLVDYRGELDFGLRQEPGQSLSNLEDFECAWRDGPSGSVAVMPYRTYEFLAHRELPMSIIGHNRKLVAVAKPEVLTDRLAGRATTLHTR